MLSDPHTSQASENSNDCNQNVCVHESHVGIGDNEAAVVKAKASLDLDVMNFKVPFMDFKPLINRYISFTWQMFNKLHEIEPIIGKNITLTIQSLAMWIRSRQCVPYKTDCSPFLTF